MNQQSLATTGEFKIFGNSRTNVSFINMLKRNRPNIDPCGTPVVTSTKLELQLLYTTYCFLSNK